MDFCSWLVPGILLTVGQLVILSVQGTVGTRVITSVNRLVPLATLVCESVLYMELNFIVL